MVARDREPNRVFPAWADALVSDPLAALSDILEGRAELGALQLAEPGDFLADLVAQPTLHAREDALVDAIDQALMEWMGARIAWPPSQVLRFGTRAYIAQFFGALVVVARLPLSSTPMHLITNVGEWDHRFRSMRWPDDVDLLRQFDIALARHQYDGQLASRWFASCDDAAWAGPHWRDGLSIALLGLRKIPDPTNTEPERLAATALARFAALSSLRRTDSLELRTEFARHVSTLAVLYPRHHSRWKETWASALASLRGFRHDRTVAQNDWLRPALPKQCFPEIYSDRNEPARSNWSRSGRRPSYLPPKAELDEVIFAVDAVGALEDALWGRAYDLLSRHWAYARYAHESHYAVRTTHNLCDRLLHKSPSDAQLAAIHGLTLQALRAEDGNAYIWDLWAKVLAAGGAGEAALDVRWEAVRRFPDNLVTRMAAIVALAGNGRVELAEHLFQETERDFANEVIEPRLLQAQRWSEAASDMWMNGRRNPLVGQLRTVIADEQFFGRMEHRKAPMRLDPRTQSVLDSLSHRAAILQRYFAPAREGSIGIGMLEPGWPSTELELVAACRTGWPRLGDQILKVWVNTRPASYSVRLLAVSRGINGDGPASDELRAVQSAFPQHRHWNEWLGYPLAGRRERTKLRQQARDQGLWGGRLSAVYPDLGVPYSRDVVSEPGPLRRLFEDVALATAGGLPRF